MDVADRVGQDLLEIGIGGGDNPAGLLQANDEGKGLPGVSQHGEPGVSVEVGIKKSAGGAVGHIADRRERLEMRGGGRWHEEFIPRHPIARRQPHDAGHPDQSTQRPRLDARHPPRGRQVRGIGDRHDAEGDEGHKEAKPDGVARTYIDQHDVQERHADRAGHHDERARVPFMAPPQAVREEPHEPDDDRGEDLGLAADHGQCGHDVAPRGLVRGPQVGPRAHGGVVAVRAVLKVEGIVHDGPIEKEPQGHDVAEGGHPDQQQAGHPRPVAQGGPCVPRQSGQTDRQCTRHYQRPGEEFIAHEEANGHPDAGHSELVGGIAVFEIGPQAINGAEQCRRHHHIRHAVRGIERHERVERQERGHGPAHRAGQVQPAQHAEHEKDG